MEAIDAHGKKTMKKTYICTSPEQDAAYGEYVYKEVYGPPVEVPTQEQLNDWLLGNMEKVLVEEGEGEELELSDEEEGPELPDEEGLSDEEMEELPNEEEEVPELPAGEEFHAAAMDLGPEAEYQNVLDAFNEGHATALKKMQKGCHKEWEQSVSPALHATMMFSATVADYQKHDSLEDAARKAAHKCAAEAAARQYVKASNTFATNDAAALQEIGHYEALHWPPTEVGGEPSGKRAFEEAESDAPTLQDVLGFAAGVQLGCGVKPHLCILMQTPFAKR